MEYVLISEKDNVKVCLDNGHKYAVRDIKKGEQIIKYGFPIGVACEDIKRVSRCIAIILKHPLQVLLNIHILPILNIPKAPSLP